MPKPSWENLDEFLQLDDAGGFAVTAALTKVTTNPPGSGWAAQENPTGWEEGDPVTYTRALVGIFDDPYLNADIGEYEADTSAPRFTCKEVDVVGVGRGDYWQRLDAKTMQPVGDLFNIMTDPQSDGAGMAILRMEPL